MRWSKFSLSSFGHTERSGKGCHVCSLHCIQHKAGGYMCAACGRAQHLMTGMERIFFKVPTSFSTVHSYCAPSPKALETDPSTKHECEMGMQKWGENECLLLFGPCNTHFLGRWEPFNANEDACAKPEFTRNLLRLLVSVCKYNFFPLWSDASAR